MNKSHENSTAGLFAGVIVVATLLAVIPVSGAQQHLLTLDDRARFQFAGAPVISPDGERIAYIFDGQVHVWSEEGSKAVTSAATEAWSPRWSADSENLYFVSDRGDSNQIWMLSLTEHGEAVQVTDYEHGVSTTTLSPDESRVLLSFSDNELDRQKAETGNGDSEEQDNKKPFVITRRQFKNDSGPGYIVDGDETHIHTYDIESNSLRPLTSGRYSETEAAWSPDGRNIVFVSNRESDPDADYRTDLWIASTSPDGPFQPRRITESTDTKQAPEWSPDGDYIAYITAEDGVYGLQHVAIVPAAGGTPEVLTSALDRWIWMFRISADGKWIYFVYDDAGSAHLARVNVSSSRIEKLLTEDGVASTFDISATGDVALTWNGKVSSSGLYRLRGKNLQKVFDANADLLDELQIGEKRKFEFTSKDGTDIEAFITFPPNYDPGQSYPAILNMHGGPVGQFAWGYDFGTQFFAANGYLVVEPNPRGSTGHGQAFIRAIYRTWGITDYDDVIAAIDYAVAQGFADPERLAATGYSYGGYMTNVVITRSTRFKAAASGAGHSLIEANVGHDMYQQWYSWELGVPWENREKYNRLSPLLRAGQVETPTLFLGGRDDWNVPILNAELFYQALQMKGVDSQLVVYPGMHHGGWTSEFENDYLQRIVAWFDKYLSTNRKVDSGMRALPQPADR